MLALTGDIPLITTAVLDDFIASATVPLPMITYRFVTRATVEAQFPNSQRTFTRLRDAVVTQADVFILHTDILHTNQPLWEALLRLVNSHGRIARVVGLKTLLKLLLRRLAMADLEETAQRLLDAPVSVGLIPHAALAMDVDKPHHLQVVRDACTHLAEFWRCSDSAPHLPVPQYNSFNSQHSRRRNGEDRSIWHNRRDRFEVTNKHWHKAIR